MNYSLQSLVFVKDLESCYKRNKLDEWKNRGGNLIKSNMVSISAFSNSYLINYIF